VPTQSDLHTINPVSAAPLSSCKYCGGGKLIHEIPEPFVDVEKAAEFLSITKRELLAYARAGKLPGHPLPGRQRKTWRFRLSELAACMQEQSAGRKMLVGSPRSRKGIL
jgi:hypothetical protein